MRIPSEFDLSGSLVVLFFICLTAWGLEAPQNAEGATLYVTASGTDIGNCPSSAPCRTIGYALIQAAASGDTIEVGSGNFQENLVINKSVTINGTGWLMGTAIDGNGEVTNQRVILIETGKTVSLKNLAILYGRASGTIGNEGAGIKNWGTAILDGVSVAFNQVLGTTTYSIGGGIFNAGTLVVIDSLVLDNSAQRGGGIFSNSSGIMVINRSVITGNHARSQGGGITNYGLSELAEVSLHSNRADSAGGGIYADGNNTYLTIRKSAVYTNTAPDGTGIKLSGGFLKLTNVSLSDNRASETSGGTLSTWSSTIEINNTTLNGNVGRGIYVETNGLASFSNSIIAGNSSGNCSVNGGTITSQGYNLSSDTTCIGYFNQTGDLNWVDPKLGPLTNNGGLTYTHALLPGSPAINAGNPAPPAGTGNACAYTDQRGVPRPQGGRCDIGAYEFVSPLYLPMIQR